MPTLQGSHHHNTETKSHSISEAGNFTLLAMYLGSNGSQPDRLYTHTPRKPLTEKVDLSLQKTLLN